MRDAQWDIIKAFAAADPLTAEQFAELRQMLPVAPEKAFPGPRRLSVDEARVHLGGEGKPLSRTKLYELERDGQIVGIRLGRRLVFGSDDLDKYLHSCRSKKRRGHYA